MELSMRNRLLVGCIAIVSAVLGYGQAARPQTPAVAPQTPAVATSPSQAAPAASAAATNRAILNQYCVTCHSDRVKTANFSLESLDINTVGDHPDVWEKVIRKLRSGVMPPPGLRRPPLAEYECLRDWLEAEIDRKAATRPNPGYIVLHRLNRTEYANVVHDLL